MTNEIGELKNKITEANEHYRNGQEDISDAIYDILLEQLKEKLGDGEYNSFLETLTEGKGKTKFDYKVGSLNKFKHSEPEPFYKWLKKHNINWLFCSEKIDGCSGVLIYKNGHFVSASSRGDGDVGVDWTNKAQLISSVRKTIPYKNEIHIRGEFTLVNDTYLDLGFKTKRSGTVGIMNSKELHPHTCLVSFFAYEVITEFWPIEHQFSKLTHWGFDVPSNVVFPVSANEHVMHDTIKNFYTYNKKLSPYDTDGIVCSSISYVPELDKFLPEAKVAFKISQSGLQTIVKNIEWNVSKGNLLKPVIIVEPVVVDGFTIGRVTGNNAAWVSDNKFGIGAEVKIARMGEVIPGIVDVVSEVEVELPTHCPECDSSLKWIGVDLACTNPDCGELKRVVHFIKNLGVENASEKTLFNWGIECFDGLVDWNSDGSKSQNKFRDELANKMYNVSSYHLMRAFSYNGFGQTLFDKVYVYSCKNNLEKMNELFNSISYQEHLLPTGVGTTTILKATPDWYNNWIVLNEILVNEKYKYTQPSELYSTNKGATMGKLDGKTFLLTGTLSRKRATIEAEIIEHGGTIVSGVSRNLQYLLVGEAAGSKLTKAQNLGITILNEEQYLQMI